jgi:hypothetical protein
MERQQGKQCQRLARARERDCLTAPLELRGAKKTKRQGHKEQFATFTENPCLVHDPFTQ